MREPGWEHREPADLLEIVEDRYESLARARLRIKDVKRHAARTLPRKYGNGLSVALDGMAHSFHVAN